MNALIQKKALLVISALMFPLVTHATVVGTGLIHQPTYLGEASEPGRIPLAPVVYHANHGYGSHSAIFQSRPCYHGHFKANGNTVYEQNLAVLFGISAEFSDSTQLHGSTVTFRLRECAPPANAPYTQEQVFAASLQCILNAAWGLRKDGAMTVVIEGDGIPTPGWASKYAKAYYSEKEGESGVLPPILLPGLKLEVSPLEVPYVVFDSVPPNPEVRRREPVFVPFLPEGESEAEAVSLVPIWPGDEWDEPLNVLARPHLPYYEKWHSGVSGRNTESVAIPHLTPPNPIIRQGGFSVQRTDTGVQVKVEDWNLTPHQLAVLIFSSVVTERPTMEKPMTFVIPPNLFSGDYKRMLHADPSWKNATSCEFAFDPVGVKLLQGSVPGYELVKLYSRVMISKKEGRLPKSFDDPLPGWIDDMIVYIRDKAPAAAREDLPDIKNRPRSLFRYFRSDSDEARETAVRSLLTLWQHDDGPAMLEAVWYASGDRGIRSLAAAMIPYKQQEVGEPSRMTFRPERESYRFEPWEAGQRREEGIHYIASAIHDALKAWEKRTTGEE